MSDRIKWLICGSTIIIAGIVIHILANNKLLEYNKSRYDYFVHDNQIGRVLECDYAAWNSGSYSCLRHNGTVESNRSNDFHVIKTTEKVERLY